MKYLTLLCLPLLLSGCDASVSMRYPKNTSEMNMDTTEDAYLAYEWIDLTDDDDPNDYIFPIDWQDEDDE